MKYLLDMASLVRERPVIKITEVTSNPAPVGLFAFGLSTFLYSLYHCHVYPMNSMVLAMAFSVGALAQIIVGIMEWKKNNIFASTTFLAFGCFWLAIFMLRTLPFVILVDSPDGNAMGTFFLIWGIFTLGLLSSSFIRSPWIMSFILLLVLVNLLLLAVFYYSHSTVVEYFAGVIGTMVGVVAIYAASGEIFNETYGAVLFPFGIREKI